ncbi:MAG: hypothetical protein ABL971_08545 [Vicinamibacterales bacterium]
MTVLVRADRLDADDPEGIRARVAELDALFEEREAELERVKSELDAFKVSYRQQVGILHEQLDELELALAEAELGILAERVPTDPESSAAPPPSDDAPEAAPRYTSDAVRRLFRDVAKAIHPDLAADEVARDRRHALMVDANRAYASGDEAQLRWILEKWERSPDAVDGSHPEAPRLRLERRITQLEMVDRDMAALQETPSWKLKAMVDEAAAKGKDLVEDMVRRLKRDIMITTNRLDAIRRPT